MTKTDGRSGIATVAEYAARELRNAEHLETRPAFDKTDAFFKEREAEQAREEAARLLKPPKALVGSADTELLPDLWPDEKPSALRLSMVCTLADPNMISVDASEMRASVATRANVLSPALDAQVTARATNSIEKMLCHQLAAVHHAGMEMLVRVQQPMLNNTPHVELVRLTNAAARLFDVFQAGCMTLQKLKTGGTQRVVVQYQQQVNVSEGGQAVIATKAGRGSRTRGKGSRNGQ